jgi:predicted 3-demethylubiquinone-9 3-methyltransferase (glyoxalase superfamily)
MTSVTPCLWFDDRAEEAANFYVSIFDDAKILRIDRYGEEGFELHGKPAGSVMTVAFEIAGQKYTALNGGPQFSFSEAISFEVHCADQEEVDYFWERLTADGGKEVQCGWLQDRFGLSWQIVPEALGRLTSDPDPARSGRVMNAMYGMKKIDIARLEKAYAGE